MCAPNKGSSKKQFNDSAKRRKNKKISQQTS